MEDLCPLCLKNGTKRKVKLLQINLQEAVWMCEEDKCPWPFGYKGFIFCPRIVGKIWSCYWDEHKSTTKLKESALSSVKQLSLCDPPATLTKSVSTDVDGSTLNLSTNHLENNGFSKKNIKNDDNDLQTFFHSKSEIFVNRNENEHENDIEETNNSNIINSSLQLVNNETGSKKVNNDCVNALNKIFDTEKDSNIENDKSTNIKRKIPKIRSIKATNIDVLNVQRNRNLDKKILCINKSTNVAGEKYFSNCSLESGNKLVNSESSTNDSCDNEITKIKSNINTTEVKIDGLPPITVSFEIPMCTTVSKTVTSNAEQSIGESTVCSDIKLSTPIMKNTLVKRKVTSGKQYEKFSFCNIKKKLETNSLIDSNSSSSEKIIKNTIRNENSDEISDSNKTITNCNSNSGKLTTSNNGSCNITTNNTNHTVSMKGNDFPSFKNISQNASTATSSINIDTVLDEFLSNSCIIPKDVNDDWIDSLFTS